MTSLRSAVGQAHHPALTRSNAWRFATFSIVLVAYILLSIAVVHRTWVLRIDADIYSLHIKRDHLTWTQYRAIFWYVTLGQRGPAFLIFLPYFIWTAYRLRSARPLVMLGVALLLLNLTVGAVKLSTGRVGPRFNPDVYKVFSGGDIYPSGHVSNAVVLYGLVAWISLRHRKLFTIGAIWIAISIGMATVAINTHWFTDVVGGWMAGGLVLLALPWFVPPTERLVEAARRRVTGTRAGAWLARHLSRRREAIDRVLPPVQTVADRGPTRTGRPAGHRAVGGAAPRAFGRLQRSSSGSEVRDTGQLDSASP